VIELRPVDEPFDTPSMARRIRRTFRLYTIAEVEMIFVIAAIYVAVVKPL
jgi:hypothetical protein